MTVTLQLVLHGQELRCILKRTQSLQNCLPLPTGTASRNFVRAITGHNFLGKHQNRIDQAISKACRFCDEEEETFHHFITECPSLRLLRSEIFHDKQLPNDNSWSINKVKLFILEPTIHNTLISKAGLREIDLEPHEIGLPSDSDSSL